MDRLVFGIGEVGPDKVRLKGWIGAVRLRGWRGEGRGGAVRH